MGLSVQRAKLKGKYCFGGLAQLARALAWQARGHRFESGILHKGTVASVLFVLI